MFLCLTSDLIVLLSSKVLDLSVLVWQVVSIELPFILLNRLVLRQHPLDQLIRTSLRLLRTEILFGGVISCG